MAIEENKPVPEPAMTGPEEAPGGEPPRVGQTHGLTPRALALGLLLVPALCAWNVYCDVVAQATEMAVLSLSIGVVFALLVLLLLNGVLKSLAPRLAFTPGEMLFVYAIQAVSIGISGVGMTQFLCMGLANVFHYSDEETRWAQYYQPLLRRWAFPDPAALPEFYDGHSTLLTASHLRGWLSPILVWSSFLLALLAVMFCLSALLRRRWVDHERLTFPLVVVPLTLVNEKSRRALLRSRVFWLGFVSALVVENLAAFAHLFPGIPFLPLKPSDPRLDLTDLFSSLPPPWNAVGELRLGFYPLVIGLTYLLPLDVSFSCWFFFLLRKMEDVLATAWGLHDSGIAPALARFPYTGEQGLGAFLGLALFSLWTARGHWQQVWGAARRGDAAEDAGEPLPARWAVGGLAVGSAALTAFAVMLGTPLLLAVALLGLYFLVVIAYTRIRAEAGLPWAFGPDMTPHQALVAAMGTSPLALPGLVGLTQFQWMDLDYRCTVMPNQLEAMKIATDAHLNPRHLSLAVLLATVVGILASWLSILACYYHYGAASARVNDYRTSMGSTPWYLLDGWMSTFAPTDWPRLIGVGVGLALTGLLTVARARFLWWPLHPIGYVLSGTFTMVWLWCPICVGWLCKWLILRYGGLRYYRLLWPLFIGLILGDYVAGSLWAVYGCLTNSQPYRVAPI